MKKPKYFAKKIVLDDGNIFDSKLEYKRWMFLKECQDEGNIESLSRQDEFELIPDQFEYRIVNLKTKTKFVKRIAERKCTYKADFTYKVDGNLVVEDTKSEYTRTKDYRIKRKLMLFRHCIKIYEVTKATQPIYNPQQLIFNNENKE